MKDSLWDLLKFAIGFFSGYAGHFFKAKYENRLISFKQKISGFVVGNSIESEDWGDISVLYRGRQASNLYSVTVEIFNESNVGFPDLDIEMAFPEGCVIYQFQAFSVHDEVKHKKILQQDTFFKYFNDVVDRWVPAYESNPHNIPRVLQMEMNTVSRMRIFTLPIFRRQSKAIFHFLIDNRERYQPEPVIDILHDKIKLIQYVEIDRRRQISLLWITGIGTLIYLASNFLVVQYSKTIVQAVWALNISCIVAIGMGWLLYRSGKWVKRYFTE
jgi:hypothetical protein